MRNRSGQVAARILTMVLVGIAALPVTAQEAPPLSVLEPGAGTDAPAPVPPVVVPQNLPGDAGPVSAGRAMSQILTVDQNALFTQSAWGRRLQAEFERRGADLEAENKRLVEQLSAEEAELTELRKTLDPKEFRTRADAFDARATQIRRERAQAAQDLNAQGDAEQAAFFRATIPVMGRLMQEQGAVAVLDRRSLLISVESIDITVPLIARIDSELGDGSNQPPVVPAPAPAPDAAGDAVPDAASDTDPDKSPDPAATDGATEAGD